ncbi:hypothetical protein STAFG_0112 [Streptomyces afghaniensis 772]|uniref:Uncharacterized protein n=1 Tax=Streptomyces afghaniensis 772 TaxID=1283301 RepID=S4N4A2_9ACTN|nr:hypothetical protein STAFG_0112 [Streptomyces afghaniensis 772]
MILGVGTVVVALLLPGRGKTADEPAEDKELESAGAR